MGKEELDQLLQAKPFTPVNQIVYNYLLDKVTSLQLEPGTKLNENQIAKELGLSRSPVQAAIGRLCDEGLAVKIPNRMAEITTVEFNDCMMLCDAREAIEGAAAYLAAKRIVSEDLDQLKRILQQCRSGPARPDNYPLLDDQFHLIIVMASKNPYLQNTYQLIRGRIMRYRWYVERYLPLDENIFFEMENKHIAIYYALKRRFSALAKEEIILDIEGMKNVLHKIEI